MSDLEHMDYQERVARLTRERDEARVEVLKWSQETYKATAERDRLRDEILRRGWWREAGAPCAICGYDGEGYYQPATHPCAGSAAALEGRDG